MEEVLNSDLQIVYFISSYRSSRQLMRLVHTLAMIEPNSQIVIHHDSSGFVMDKLLFWGMPQVHLLTSEHPIVWGDIYSRRSALARFSLDIRKPGI